MSSVTSSRFALAADTAPAARGALEPAESLPFRHPNLTANYRIRVLLYAGKPNWTLLDTLTPT